METTPLYTAYKGSPLWTPCNHQGAPSLEGGALQGASVILHMSSLEYKRRKIILERFIVSLLLTNL